MRRKLLLPIIALAMLVALGACSNEELFQEANPEITLGSGRTLTLTASMPEEPSTRVGLEQQADKSIALTWEATDELQLAFVQGNTKIKQTVTIKNISGDRKKAEFDIELPASSTGFNDNENFDLYGVYGGGKKTFSLDIGLPGDSEPGDVGIKSYHNGDALLLGDANTNPHIILPKYTASTASLNEDNESSIQNRKDVMLSFESKDIDATNPHISVIFKHIGSLFCITLENIGNENLFQVKELKLVGINNSDNQEWAYNSGDGGKTFDLVEQKFLDTENADNYISIKPASKPGTNISVESGKIMSFWTWFPPLTDKNWPELQLELQWSNAPIVISGNSKPAREAPLAAGKAYYVYATWDGSNITLSTEHTVNVAEMGTLSSLLSAPQKEAITKLIVTGEINKADYKVIINNMPNLNYLDLSKVTTYDGTTINKIPDFVSGDNLNYNIKLTKIILPKNVTAIGNCAFCYYQGLKGPLTLPEELETIGDAAFSGRGALKGTLTIPNGVTEIGKSAFYGCLGFTGNLVLPVGLTIIRENSFYDCRGLTGHLIIPNGVTTIENLAFYTCNNISGVTFPALLTTIGESAFLNCSNLTGTIVFPETLESVGRSAFLNADNSTKVTAFRFHRETPITYNEKMLWTGYYNVGSIPIQVPAGSVDAYKEAPGWSDHAANIVAIEE